MIYSLTGTLTDILDDKVVIDINGMGYEVFIAQKVKPQLPNLSENIKLFTHHHIREDQQTLFGFLSLKDKYFFTKLTSVSGVGPKVALKMLSDLDSMDIATAILSNNIPTLTQISGVGKKMAERLIIELKDKLDFMPTISVDGTQRTPLSLSNEFNTDLTLALKTLGYTHDEIQRSIAKSKDALSDNMSLEAAIKLTLKTL